MAVIKVFFVIVFALVLTRRACAQTSILQQGLVLKRGTSIRLGSIWIVNKRTRLRARSNTFGVFDIAALPGDTLSFEMDNYQECSLIATDLSDKVIYMDPAVRLDEVVVKEHSLSSDIAEVRHGYKKKSVFYTGTPHYYYLVLKPMTFIYENFKSEVKEARRFNRYAGRETASIKIAGRFNDAAIRKIVPISDGELERYKDSYTPSLKQLNSMSDYDLINYIKKCYREFKSGYIPHDVNLV